MEQLSFWSADARPRARGDLEGLLCGPGRAELFGRGSLARLVIVLGPPPEADEQVASDGQAGEGQAGEGEKDYAGAHDGDLDDLVFLDLEPDEMAARLSREPVEAIMGLAAKPPDRDGGFADVERQRRRQADKTPDHYDALEWRARAVRCALGARGVPAEIGCAGDGRPEVRTAFRADLLDLARAWTAGDGTKKVPAEFELDGPRLRLWVLAAGLRDGRTYTLGLDPQVRGTDGDLLTASRRLGLDASLRPPALRIVGARRQRRLGELVGRPPSDLIDGVWPV